MKCHMRPDQNQSKETLSFTKTTRRAYSVIIFVFFLFFSYVELAGTVSTEDGN